MGKKGGKKGKGLPNLSDDEDVPDPIAAGGGSGGFALVLLALVLVIRRRRSA